MKKLLLSFTLMGCLGANAQTTLYEDSFESYNDFVITGFGNWLTLDFDLRPTYTGGTDTPTWDNSNDPQAWQIFNPTTAGVTNAASGTEVRNFDPRTGAKYAASWAAVPGAGGVSNDDWLVSPPITLAGSGNTLTVYLKSMSDSYGLEEYNVGVYVGSGTPTSGDDFIGLTGGLAPYGTWEMIEESLDGYANQTIRIGIQNFGLDHYMLMADDFKVTTTGLNVNENFFNKFSVYPNPAKSLISVSNSEGIEINSINVTDVNGRVVKTLNTTGVSEIALNVADLTPGVYMVNMETASGKAVKKFIKE